MCHHSDLPVKLDKLEINGGLGKDQRGKFWGVSTSISAFNGIKPEKSENHN